MKRLRNNFLTISASLAILIFLAFLFRALSGADDDTAKTSRISPPDNAAIPKETFNSALPESINMLNNDTMALNDNTSDRALFQRFSIDNNMRITKGNLDRTYAPLFAKLKLASDEIELFKDLLAEYKYAKETAQLQEGTFQNDLRTKETVKDLEGRTQQEILGNIAGMLGAERYSEFMYYESTLPQRSEVEKIEGKFSYEAEPLTSEQKELLIDIFREQARLRDEAKNSTQNRPGKKSKMKTAYPYKSNILKQASPYLSESQVKSLQKHLDAQK